MKLQKVFDFENKINQTQVFFVGDVKDVIFSRAGAITCLPEIYSGFGAGGANKSTTIGESIVFRENIASTPPNTSAGVKVNRQACCQETFTPFFVGWRGMPCFTTKFNSEEGLSLKQVYEIIFSKLQEIHLPYKHNFLFLEIVGLLNPAEIQDRALQKSVEKGNVLTTSKEHAEDFYKSRVIYRDLLKRGRQISEVFPLCIAGAGYLNETFEPELTCLKENIFYSPPNAKSENHRSSTDKTSKVITHNHALGWRAENSDTKNLSALIRNINNPPQDELNLIDSCVNGLLKKKFDYLVHLDDWSILRAAEIKIYLAPTRNFQIVSTNKTLSNTI